MLPTLLRYLNLLFGKLAFQRSLASEISGMHLPKHDILPTIFPQDLETLRTPIHTFACANAALAWECSKYRL